MSDAALILARIGLAVFGVIIALLVIAVWLIVSVTED